MEQRRGIKGGKRSKVRGRERKRRMEIQNEIMEKLIVSKILREG